MVNWRMVGKSPKDRVVGPLTNGRTPWLINGGDPNHLLIGMILQVDPQVDGYFLVMMK